MSRAPDRTALQRVLTDVDRAASAQLGVTCQTRFGRAVDWAAGDVPCRVEKQPTGRYAYFVDGQRLRGFDGLVRSVLDALRGAQRRLREHDTLWVTLGDQNHRIRLYPMDREHGSHYGALAGREVSVPPADEPGGAPTSSVLEARLAGYLSILKGQEGWLERFPDGLNDHVPRPLERLEMVTETTFADGAGVVYTDLKLLPTLGCNQRCLFCCAREQRRPFGVQRLRATLEQLSREADLERTKLSFSGGEPTLHPDLAELLRYARELGFPWIGLQTNGVRLAEPPLLAALAPAARADSPTVYLDRRAPGTVPAHVRVKHEGCRVCVLDARCGGVCGEYARTVGLQELSPISE